MQLIPLKLKLLRPGDDLVGEVVRAAKKQGGPNDGDVIVIASKAVATTTGALVKLDEVHPSRRAISLAKRTGQPPALVEVILREADAVLGASRGVVLAIKDGILCANAGVDRSNVPAGHAALMPEDPEGEAEKIRKRIFEMAGVKVGVIITDSSVKPLRLGTVGVAIGVAGIEPVVDRRGDPDLFGKPLKVTFQAIADQLATAAQLLMGEGAERIPVVIVRGANVRMIEKSRMTSKVSPEDDLYREVFRKMG